MIKNNNAHIIRLIAISLLISFVASCSSWQKNTATTLNSIKAIADSASKVSAKIYHKKCTEEAKKCLAENKTVKECTKVQECWKSRTALNRRLKALYSSLGLCRNAFVIAIESDKEDKSLNKMIAVLLSEINSIMTNLKGLKKWN